MKTRSPLFWALMAGVVVLAAAFAPVLWQMLQPTRPPTPPTSLALRSELPAPWQIEPGAQGELRAFGLRLPGSTLADAVERWGNDLLVALIASRNQAPALEAYTDRWSGGGVTGKLVLSTDASDTALARWVERSTRRETIDANAQRWALNAQDRAEALRSRVVGLSFLPSSRIDAATLQARFGAPGEVVAGEGRVRHWLYPDRAMAIAWDEASGKAVVQVALAADFERRLRAPVMAAAAARKASEPGPAASR